MVTRTATLRPLFRPPPGHGFGLLWLPPASRKRTGPLACRLSWWCGSRVRSSPTLHFRLSTSFPPDSIGVFICDEHYKFRNTIVHFIGLTYGNRPSGQQQPRHFEGGADRRPVV